MLKSIRKPILNNVAPIAKRPNTYSGLISALEEFTMVLMQEKADWISMNYRVFFGMYIQLSNSESPFCIF